MNGIVTFNSNLQSLNGSSASSNLPLIQTQSGSRSVGATEVLRSKGKKRDDAIRRKVEQELDRRNTTRRRSNTVFPSPSNHHHNHHTSQSTSTLLQRRGTTVSSLRPNPAVTIGQHAKIIQAAQLMAAKRTDAVLVLNERGDLIGILTDKDIAFRVVAEGLDVRTTPVSEVMTLDPIAVFDQGSRNEALNIMISRKFRHLPVIVAGDEQSQVSGSGARLAGNVGGVLDITKCVFERLEDLERKVNEDQSIMNAMEVLERRGSMTTTNIDTLRPDHSCPSIASILSKTGTGRSLGDFPSIGIKHCVKEAAKIMKMYHATAVLVTGTPDGIDKVGGILTTKDIVLRVIAASLDPATTSVVRVMTPHPDFVSSTDSILDALKKLHAGHFLHLPVIDETNPVGLVDVNKSGADFSDIDNNGGNILGSQWNVFWNNTFAPPSSAIMDMDPPSPSYTAYSKRVESRHSDRDFDQHDTGRDSVISQTHSHRESLKESHRESISRPRPVTLTSVDFDISTTDFHFKLKDLPPSGTGKIYRFSCRGDSLEKLYASVLEKTGYTSHYGSSDSSGGNPLDITTLDGALLRLCYQDDEGDVVALESDADLEEAVLMACGLDARRVLLFLAEPGLGLEFGGIRGFGDVMSSTVASDFDDNVGGGGLSGGMRAFNQMGLSSGIYKGNGKVDVARGVLAAGAVAFLAVFVARAFKSI